MNDRVLLSIGRVSQCVLLVLCCGGYLACASADADRKLLAAPEQCLGLSDIRYSISDIELRTERIVWGHATGPDYVVVLNRFTELESALRDEVGLALSESEAQEFSETTARLLVRVQEVSGSSLNLHAQKKKMEREFKYLSEDILKSRYPSGELRPHGLLLAAQRMLDSDINTIGLVALEALLAQHHQQLVEYCAPTYKPCSDPQYKSGELFAKATTDYISLSRKLSSDFSLYQDELFDLRDEVEMYLTERCGG